MPWEEKNSNRNKAFENAAGKLTKPGNWAPKINSIPTGIEAQRTGISRNSEAATEPARSAQYLPSKAISAAPKDEIQGQKPLAIGHR
jgi:hypothetical protein